MASSWNGRVLIHISVAITKKPKLKVKKVEETYRKIAISKGLFALKEFDMIAEFG